MANVVATGVTQAVDQASASLSSGMDVVSDIEKLVVDGVITPVNVGDAAFQEVIANVRKAGADARKAFEDFRKIIPFLAANP